MPCIQLGSSVGCSRVPQVHFIRKHFVRKQTMCKSLYTYLTICFAFEKPRWLLHNTADRAETVFSHLKKVDEALFSAEQGRVQTLCDNYFSQDNLPASLPATLIA